MSNSKDSFHREVERMLNSAIARVEWDNQPKRRKRKPGKRAAKTESDPRQLDLFGGAA